MPARYNLRTLCLSLVMMTVYATAQEISEPKKNLDVLQEVAERIAIKVSSNIPAQSTLRLQINPKDAAWYFESGLYHGFQKNNLETTTADSAMYLAVFSFRDSHIRYERPRGDNVFGDRVVDRSVSLRLDAKLERCSDSMPLLVQQFSEELTDTINADQIDDVENPLIAASKGTLQPGGFFSSFLEPVLILGSVGIAVFLLFHVRS